MCGVGAPPVQNGTALEIEIVRTEKESKDTALQLQAGFTAMAVREPCAKILRPGTKRSGVTLKFV